MKNKKLFVALMALVMIFSVFNTALAVGENRIENTLNPVYTEEGFELNIVPPDEEDYIKETQGKFGTFRMPSMNYRENSIKTNGLRSNGIDFSKDKVRIVIDTNFKSDTLTLDKIPEDHTYNLIQIDTQTGKETVIAEGLKLKDLLEGKKEVFPETRKYNDNGKKYNFRLDFKGKTNISPVISKIIFSSISSKLEVVTIKITFSQIFNTTVTTQWFDSIEDPKERGDVTLVMSNGSVENNIILEKVNDTPVNYNSKSGLGTPNFTDSQLKLDKKGAAEKFSLLINGKKSGDVTVTNNVVVGQNEDGEDITEPKETQYQYEITGNEIDGWIVKLGEKLDITFKSGEKGKFSGETDETTKVISVGKGFTVTPPTVTPYKGFTHICWEPTVVNPVSEAATYTAQYIGETVIEEPETPTAPEGYVRVVFDAAEGNFGKDEEQSEIKKKTYDVDLSLNWSEFKEKIGSIPSPIAPEGKNHTGWNPVLPGDDTKVTAKTYSAQYHEDIVDGSEDKLSDDYVKVTFLEGEHGKFANPYNADTNPEGEQTSYWVKKDANKTVSDLSKPTITANEGYSHIGWDKLDSEVITNDLNITATYDKSIIPVDPGEEEPDKPERYITIEFLPGENGTLEGTTKYYVDPEMENLDAAVKKLQEPTIKANIGWKVKEVKWDPVFPPETFVVVEDKDLYEYTAQYTELGDIIPGTGEDDNPNEKPDGYVIVTFSSEHSELEGETVYYVNPIAGKTLADITKPSIKEGTVETGWKALGTWDKEDTTAIDNTLVVEGLEVKANFEKLDEIIPVDDPDTPTPVGYVRVTYNTGEGKFADESTEKTFDVKVGTQWTEVNEEAGNPLPPENKTFIKWNKPTETETVVPDGEPITVTAIYKETVVPVDDPDTPVTDEDYVRVVFDATEGGLIEGTTKQKVGFNVLKGKSLGEKLPKTAVKTEWTFQYWYDQADESKKDANLSKETKFLENKTYVAEYKENVKEVEPDSEPEEGYVRVTFDATEGGTVGTTNKQNLYYDVLIGGNLGSKYPTNATKRGYTFKHWSETESGESANLTAETTFTEPKDYFAVYDNLDEIISVDDPDTPTPVGYVRVTYNTGEGKFADESTEKILDVKAGTQWTKVNEKAGNPLPPENKTFIKWNKPTETETVVPDGGPITVTAIYKETVVPVEDPDTPVTDEDYVRVVFDATEGGLIEGTTKQKVGFDVLKTKKFGEVKSELPSSATKPGFTFKDWDPVLPGDEDLVLAETYTATYDEKGSVVPIEEGEEITDKDYVKVTFDANGGILTGVNKEVQSYKVLKTKKFGEVKSELPSSATKSGFTFKDWNPTLPGDEDLVVAETYTATYIGDIVDGSEDKPSDNHVLVTFAEGEKGSFTNPYSEDNTDGDQTSYWVRKDAGKKVSDLTKPSITPNLGYEHNGWDVADDTVISAEMTITAQYLDTSGPNITDESATNEPDEYYTTVTGNVTDNDTPSEEIEVTVTVDGNTFDVVPNSDGSFEVIVPKPKNNTEISITATDNSGNSSESTIQLPEVSTDEEVIFGVLQGYDGDESITIYDGKGYTFDISINGEHVISTEPLLTESSEIDVGELNSGDRVVITLTTEGKRSMPLVMVVY